MNARTDPFEELDLRTLLRGLLRSWGWILAGLGLGALAGQGLGVVRPNTYVSEGKIEVRLGMRERRSPESSLDPEQEPAPMPGIHDEIELLDNPRVWERVALEIGPARLLAPYDPAASDDPETPFLLRWQHALQSWWFRRPAADQVLDELASASEFVEDSIDIVALSGTSYLVVRATATDPELARILTRTFVSVARQWHREVYAAGEELSLVSGQAELNEGESAAAEQAFSTHRDACGFFDLEAQKEGLIASIFANEERIRGSSVKRIELEDELAFVTRELARTPATVERIVPPSVKVNPEYQAALERLQALASERATLGSVYTEGSELHRRRADQLDQEIRRVDEQLNGLPEFIELGVATRENSANPRHEELTHRASELAREFESEGKELELWKRTGAEQDERLRAALQCEPVHRELSYAVERTKARSLELLRALEQAQALALLDQQENMDSLRIVQDGDLPRRKAGPDRKRFLLLGSVGGLAAGVLLAVLRFLLDQRLHEPEDLQKETDLALLAVVPETRAVRLASERGA